MRAVSFGAVLSLVLLALGAATAQQVPTGGAAEVQSDVESELHVYLEAQAGSAGVPPRVQNAQGTAGPTQVAVGIAIVSLHDVNVVSGTISMAIWQRMQGLPPLLPTT